jgi:hypothetical protein
LKERLKTERRKTEEMRMIEIRYITFNKKGINKMYKSLPADEAGELYFKLEVIIDPKLFEKPQFSMNLTLTEKSLDQRIELLKKEVESK